MLIPTGKRYEKVSTEDPSVYYIVDPLLLLSCASFLINPTTTLVTKIDIYDPSGLMA